jgi:hypothetical protein
MGITPFAFITEEEFMNNYLGANGQDCSATAELTLKKASHNKLLKKH